MTIGTILLLLLILILVGALPILAPQQELGLLPKQRAWTHCLDSARASSYGPALETEILLLFPEKELAS